MGGLVACIEGEEGSLWNISREGIVSPSHYYTPLPPLHSGREVREQMFEKVAKLLHDLDEGMIPISTIAPYLPIAVHRKRDRCAVGGSEGGRAGVRGRRSAQVYV